MSDITYSTKSQGEQFPLSFNFLEELGEQATATVTATVLYGEDNAPELLLDGSPIVSESSVVQRIMGGEPGCVYRITCTVENSPISNKYSAFVVLAVLSDEPSLVIETGDGIEGANSYVGVEYLNAYHAARGNLQWLAASVTEQEAAALRAMAYIETLKYRGQKATVSQSCVFPRVGVVTRDRHEWPSDEVPEQVRMAQAEGAIRELITPGSLLPDWEVGKGPKRRERLGDMEEEWFKQHPDDGKYPFQIILRLLADFIIDPTEDSSKILYTFDVERT